MLIHLKYLNYVCCNIPGSLPGNGMFLFEQWSGGVPNRCVKIASVIKRNTSAAAIGPLETMARRSWGDIGIEKNVASPFWIAVLNPVPSAGNCSLLFCPIKNIYLIIYYVHNIVMC